MGGSSKSLYRNEHCLEEAPVLHVVLAPYFACWERIRDVLASAWETQDTVCHTQIRDPIGLAISFHTWWWLALEQGLEDAEAVKLMMGMVRRICGYREILSALRQSRSRSGTCSLPGILHCWL